MTPYIAGIIYGVVLGAAIAAVLAMLWAASRQQARTRGAVVRVLHLHGSGPAGGESHLAQYYDLACDECGTEWSGATPLPALEMSQARPSGEVSPRNSEITTAVES